MSTGIVLTYHGLEGGGLPGEATADPLAREYLVSAGRFHEALDLIPPERSVTVSDLANRPSGDWVCVTFDDGLVSDAAIAAPELARRGLKATFFVTVGNVGRRGYCSWEDLGAMSRQGMEIGSHGMTHRPLVDLERTQAEAEIRESKGRLEDGLGIGVSAFAPVGGHFTDWMVDVARAAGYGSFATMVPGRTTIRGAPVLVRRNHVMARHGLAHVRRVLEGRRVYLAGLQVRYYLLLLPKMVFGLRGYERVKAVILRLRPGSLRASAAPRRLR